MLTLIKPIGILGKLTGVKMAKLLDLLNRLDDGTELQKWDDIDMDFHSQDSIRIEIESAEPGDILLDDKWVEVKKLYLSFEGRWY